MKFLKGVIIFILFVAVMALVVLGYLGFVPGISALFGSDKPRDLEIDSTPNDLDSFNAKTNIELVVLDSSQYPESSLICEGSRPLDVSFTSEELTAAINSHYPNWVYYPVKDVQIRIGENGEAQASGILMVDRLKGYTQATGADYSNIEKARQKVRIVRSQVPFLFTGKLEVMNNKVDLTFSKIEFGRLPVPGSLSKKYKTNIDAFFNQQIGAYTGLSVQSLDFANGTMNFNGSLPEKVTTARN